ncbi:hypothetical protein BaRGS_00014820 [Batillaria attramentaria]|uniref:Uncharacterized protein n=1 Tax=Batillaria attramentaria TaxID=370345 RepID=A0ABD0L3X7_9CAEN
MTDVKTAGKLKAVAGISPVSPLPLGASLQSRFFFFRKKAHAPHVVGQTGSLISPFPSVGGWKPCWRDLRVKNTDHRPRGETRLWMCAAPAWMDVYTWCTSSSLTL